MGCCLQVVMRLLNNLAGVSPSTYPKHPVDILLRLTCKLGLPGVKFAAEKNESWEVAETRYRGRARMRNIWLTGIVHGSTRFSVRTKCAEEVLKQFRHDSSWLQQIQIDEDGKCVVEDLGKWAQTKLHQQIVDQRREEDEKKAREAAEELRQASEKVCFFPSVVPLKLMTSWIAGHMCLSRREYTQGRQMCMMPCVHFRQSYPFLGSARS